MTTRDRTSSSKKRKSSTTTDKQTKKMWKSGKKKKTADTDAADKVLETMFTEICDPEDPTTSNMEGIFVLGTKLDIDAVEDIRALVLLYKLGCAAKPPGCLQQTEFIAGCHKLDCSSWDDLKNLVPALDTGFMESVSFRDFYKFCFQFNLEGTHRTLDRDLVVALLPMVLTERVNKERLASFGEFLSASTAYTRITLDQWTSFLDFCLEVTDLKDYDESTSAWPVLLDEFVEYVEEQAKK